MPKKCSIKDCSNKHKAKNLCEKHYRQQYYKKYYIRNKAHIQAQQKTYRELVEYKSKPNSESQKKWRSKNKDYFSTYKREYRKNPHNRIAHNLRSRLNSALKGNMKVGSSVGNLGCSIQDLKKHLEAQFEPGMSWSNYGKWHIDHIKPLSAFDLTKSEQVKEACHYSNLQPMWASENISKGGA